jgi:hypothetical protein
MLARFGRSKMKLEIKDIIGPLITATALSFGVIQYGATSYDEFVKPVREAQLKLYQEISDTAALIATQPKDSPEQGKNRRDFLRLYYGPLTMLEDFSHGRTDGPDDPTVEEAATVFKTCLERQDCKDDAEAVHKLSRALAYTCRESLRKSWRYKAAGFRPEHKTTILEYEKRFQKATVAN